LRELVPGADREAIVAAIDPVADRLAEFARNRALVFDGEIGNAAAGIEPDSTELTMVPKNTVALQSDVARKVLRLVEILEDLDDVHDVYANFDIPDEVLEEMASMT